MLGVGYDEHAYHQALKRRFHKKALGHRSKERKALMHRGCKVREFEADFIAFDKIILELKTLQSNFIKQNYVQIISELKLWQMQLGLLVNFGLQKVEFERIPLRCFYPLGKMIIPRLKDEALLEDIRAAAADHSSFHLWWLGQSGFLVQWQSRHLLLDPYLSDSLTKKYAHTGVPHVRMTELVIDPVRLDFITVATSSHNHTDHLDAETLVPLMQANPNLKLIIPEANRKFVADRLGIEATIPLGLNDGESVEVSGFKFTAVPAAHEEIERDEFGRSKFLGYVIQFGSWCLYHSGDTMWHDEIVMQLKKFSIDVALLPINGKKIERKVAGNLDAREAVRLAKIISARLVIPCHYDMFTFNTADPDELAKEAEAEGQAYRILQCGERWSSTGIKTIARKQK